MQFPDFRANLIFIILKINELGISSKTAHSQLNFGFINAKLLHVFQHVGKPLVDFELTLALLSLKKIN